MPTYITRIKNYKLIRKPTYQNIINGLPQVVYGEKIKFGNQGKYQTKDKNEIEFLENHPDFNKVFYKQAEEDSDLVVVKKKKSKAKSKEK